MPTVFDRVVFKLVLAGNEIARQDPTFYSTSYDIFARRVWTDRSSMQGLPPEVFVRALKTAYREVTGNVLPNDPKPVLPDED
jgi:hypothetical protein